MSGRLALLVGLYGLSGAVGLAWQVVQVRAFLPVFGASAEAIAAVTSTFLAGLALGAALAPRLLRRVTALRAYALLEAGVGIWGAALPWGLVAAGPLLVEVLRAAGDGGLALALRLLLAVVLVGPLAVALGATFPAVASAVDSDRVPARVGLLYGVNALGAAAGALAAGLWLPWALGLTRGSLLLGLGNLLVAGTAWAFSRREGVPAESPGVPESSTGAVSSADGAPAGLWLTAAATGFVALGLELCWARTSGPLLAAVSGSDAVAFAVVLAAVVAGIGLGGVLARRVRDGLGRPLGRAQLALCLLTLATLEPLRTVVLGATHKEWIEGLLPALPALWLGVTFPLLSNALAEAGQPASKALGRLYAVNTAGAVVGALATGFWLMPWLGAQRLAAVLAAISALVAASGWWRSGARLPAGVAGLVGIGLSVAMAVGAEPVAGARLIPPFEEVIDALEGRQGSTLVSGRPGGNDRALTSSGHRIGAANRTGPVNDHALRALGPAALHEAPGRVLSIGLGTGATAEAFLSLDTVEELVVVELDPNMRRLLPHFGTEEILDDRRLTVVDGDGRWFVRADSRTWDVIAVDAYDPRTASATFYTAEFYAEARRRLAPGGVLFVKFNPASLTEPEPLAGYLATLFSSFPEGALFFVERGLFGLVGVEDLDQLPPERVVAARASASELLSGARLHTDDRPLRVRDRPGASFDLITPYWTAQQGSKTRPPWMGRGGPPRR